MHLPAILLVRLVLLERAVSFLTPASIELQHRFLPFPSSASEPSWQPLGSASIDGEMTATRLEKDTGQGGKELGRDWDMDDGKGWYQVGVESEGDWIIASTRAVSSSAVQVSSETDLSVSLILFSTISNPTNDRLTPHFHVSPNVQFQMLQQLRSITLCKCSLGHSDPASN